MAQRGTSILVLLRTMVAALLSAALLMIASCDRLPRDPAETFERVHGGVLRVGVIQRDPWTRIGDDGQVYGVDGRLVRRLADLLDAKVEWVVAPEQDLFEALQRYELGLVVGGLTRDSPWRKDVAFTLPYVTAPIEVGAPPGARAIGEIDGRKIAVPQGSAIAAMVEEQDGVPVEIEPQLLPRFDGLIAAPRWQLLAWQRVPTGVELHEDQHVWAVPPGENRWLVYVERFLARQRGEVDTMLMAEATEP